MQQTALIEEKYPKAKPMNAQPLQRYLRLRRDRYAPTLGSAQMREVIRVGEMLVFALIAPLIGMLLFSHDPLGFNSGFPWAAVGPIVFAARYGSSWGVACAIAAAFVMLMPNTIYADTYSLNIALAVGTVVVALVVGDSSSSWRRRSGQAEAENEYLRHRLKEFSKDYHVLKVSHGQLEEVAAGQRLSLRNALQQLKPVLSSSQDGLQAGSELMAIFAQFCSVQIAGLYTMKTDKLPNSTPVAIHGNMGELSLFDPLLTLAIKERKLVSIKLAALATDSHESSLLAVVPIVDSNDYLHGILAVKDMHFMAFQQENLNILSLLGGYIGDMISRSKGLGNSRAGWFLAELDTALRFARTNSVDSSLISIKLKRFNGDKEVADLISSNIRSLDASWMPKASDGQSVIVILLPLIRQSQCEAYLKRVNNTLLKEFDLSLAKVVTSLETKQIKHTDTRQSCLNFIQESAEESRKLKNQLKIPKRQKRSDSQDNDNDKGMESVA